MTRKQLQDLTNTQNDDITPEFLIDLLRQRRVLVIIDHFSEMEKSTRDKILAALNENPFIALVFTSRVVGELQNLTKSILKPMRVEGKRISEFLGEYLKLRDFRNKFDDEEFYNACSRLNRMVGQREITIMLAKLYADQMIATKQGDTELPENIPDLMLSYLNQLHPQAGLDQQSIVHQDLKIIAWKCLENTYSPAPISRRTAKDALVSPDSNEIDSHLDYLQNKLNILLKVEPDKVKINLDPLAEYLAGLYLVQKYQDSASHWQNLLRDIDEKSEDQENNQGFLLALWDCCEIKKKDFKIPDFVIEELLKKANLDPEETKAWQRKQRIKKLIDELSTSEVEFRLRAVIDLQTMGKDANPAIPRLRRLLEDNTEIAKIRIEAAKALKQFEQEIPMIIAQINNGVESIGLKEHPPTNKIDLGNKVILEMVPIQSGIFLMGAPETKKDSRDSESPQHSVTIQNFCIGKYPVTQAQWRAVAALPRINKELEADPSNFKGEQRPVEQVSWHDAVEFCDRLSSHTKRQYRLPSEAEWEYACRARTTTPFHFGETITSELASYNATETYGAGVKGTYREETTPVGSFEVANAFGLYDMHGNVLEWCLDDWHDNYEGSPTDGSAWLDNNDDNLSQKQGNVVLRGGSWRNYSGYCRSAYRYSDTQDYYSYHIGFRIVCAAGMVLQ
ncbi:formylglycine-generating enzyme family protein (plasmid) [Nostoc sp. C057]|nr:formylglycine-generating enzyme family protein [Nostoc sp. C057]